MLCPKKWFNLLNRKCHCSTVYMDQVKLVLLRQLNLLPSGNSETKSYMTYIWIFKVEFIAFQRMHEYTGIFESKVGTIWDLESNQSVRIHWFTVSCINGLSKETNHKWIIINMKRIVIVIIVNVPTNRQFNSKGKWPFLFLTNVTSANEISWHL